MNRADFVALPHAIALGMLYDAIPEIAQLEAPKVPQSPKYDTRVRVKGGYVFASEADLSQLRYYLERANKPGDPKYEERNQKEAKALSYFVAWREANPTALWQGERYGRGVVRAMAPSSRPEVSDWDGTPVGAKPSAEVSHDPYAVGDDDQELPF